MAIHIGKLVHEKVRRSSLKNKQITDHLNRSENTIYDIYKRDSIDTDSLLKLCEIIDFDFFSVYYTLEPLKTWREQEQAKVKSHIQELETAIKRKDEEIATLRRLAAIQEELMNSLKEERARNQDGKKR